MKNRKRKGIKAPTSFLLPPQSCLPLSVFFFHFMPRIWHKMRNKKKARCEGS